MALGLIIAIAVNRIVEQEIHIVDMRAQLQLDKQELDRLKKEAEDLKEQRQQSSTDEYIEKTARKKLDMFLPNERVYIYSR